MVVSLTLLLRGKPCKSSSPYRFVAPFVQKTTKADSVESAFGLIYYIYSIGLGERLGKGKDRAVAVGEETEVVGEGVVVDFTPVVFANKSSDE